MTLVGVSPDAVTAGIALGFWLVALIAIFSENG